MIKEGKKKTLTMTVTKSKTALSMKSGSLEVLATPALVAHMEQTAHAILKQEEKNLDSVGGFVLVRHTRPSKVGSKIKTTALITKVEGRKITFVVSSSDENGNIAQGEHIRFLVDSSEFLKKV